MRRRLPSTAVRAPCKPRPTIASALVDTLLTVVDVGARGKPTVPVRKLEPVRLVAIEPDEDEAKRLAESLARYSLAHVDVLPVALGYGGPAVLHVARSGGY